jgi:hypothetical protein
VRKQSDRAHHKVPAARETERALQPAIELGLALCIKNETCIVARLVLALPGATEPVRREETGQNGSSHTRTRSHAPVWTEALDVLRSSSLMLHSTGTERSPICSALLRCRVRRTRPRRTEQESACAMLWRDAKENNALSLCSRLTCREDRRTKTH